MLIENSIRKYFTREQRRLKFKYRDFINSHWWEDQKAYWYISHKKECARCKSTDRIVLHHKTYPVAGRFLSLGNNDLVPLCQGCHYKYHAENGVQRKMGGKTSKFIKKSKYGRH